MWIFLYTRVLEEYPNIQWIQSENFTMLQILGLLYRFVCTDSLWHLLKFAVILPQGLGWKYLEFHLHLCPSEIVKNSFVFNLAHHVSSGTIYTHDSIPFFQTWWKTDHIAFSRNFRHKVATASPHKECLAHKVLQCPCFWMSGIVSSGCRREDEGQAGTAVNGKAGG